MTKQSRFSNILLAVALTPDERRLTALATEFQQTYQAHLKIIHVIKDVPSFIDRGQYYHPEQLQDNVHEATSNQMLELGKALGVQDQKDLVIAHGNIADRIIDIATATNTDLIIVGSHTKTGFAKIIGSSARAVSENAPCDVHLVKCPGLIDN